MKIDNFFSELKRRNVYKVAVAYIVAGWALSQGIAQVFPVFDIPNWVIRLIVLLIIIGLPIALILAWMFELTPQGIKRTEDVDPSAASRALKKHAWIYVVVIGAAISAALFFLGRYTAGNKPAPTATNELSAKSIAVLPFDNLSEEKNNAYFAEGIQDEILARLSKISELKVISRTSTQKYKSAPANLREIAQQLGVANILEGSVQKAGDQVRITVQLINALTDNHLWADTYDRKMIDIFGVESDVAQKIAASLEAKLTGREKNEINAHGTNNAEAYDAFLHALALQDRQGVQDLEQLIKFARRAVELDPNYAQAWCLLALGESQKYFYPEHTEAQLARARTAAETANRLAPDSAEGPAALGIFNYYCLRNYDVALTQFQIAHERAPNDANGLLSIGLVKRRQGHVEESITVQQEAARLDPLNEDIWANIGRGYRGLRHFEEARTAFDRAHSIAPNDLEIPAQLAETYVAQGDLATAWKIMEPLTFAPTERGFGTKVVLLVFQRRFDDAERMISAATAGKDLPSLFVAISHSALANLRITKGDRAGAQPFLVQAESELNQLRGSGGNSVLLRDALLTIEANLGHRDEALKIADSLLETTRNDVWQFPREEEAVARACVALKDFDRAIPLIEHALSVPAVESLTIAYLRVDPSWDPIRNDPRFQKLANSGL
jgi:TolB-like protein/cytochrome c-type biogenesis protein CcmH/NrfG